MKPENNEIWEQIDRYLNHNMDVVERQDFEAAMAQDDYLAAQVEASQIAVEVVVGHEVLKLKSQMQKDLAAPKYKKLYIAGILLISSTIGLYLAMEVPSILKTDAPKVSTQQRDGNIRIQETSPDTETQKNMIVSKPEKKTQGTIGVDTIQLDSLIQTKKVNPTSPSVLHKADSIKTIITSSTPKEVPTLPHTIEEKSLCADITIAVETSTVPSCDNRPTGEIHVKKETIKGGTAPYLFSLNARNNFGSEDFTHLKPGVYHLYIKDANNCVSKYGQTLMVEETVCQSKKEFTYNLNYDPAWVIPYDHDKEPKSIKILDKSGRDVYISPVYNGTPTEWMGQSNTGQEVGIGLHIYIIEYTNGGMSQGTIMIVK
ncbi:MAG TPA: hypothetical protein VL947_13850 [Cytophagales bacterium]|nr:hypothetical protein [Cytophagales bacterium]